MSETRIFGASDDLIEFVGGFEGEVSCFGTDDEDHNGVLLCVSDGTVLRVAYCMRVGGVWGIDVLNKGPLFHSYEVCTDEDADPYSDVVTLKDGVKFVYAATEWEKVR